jgi:Prealbumin-like fold domain
MRGRKRGALLAALLLGAGTLVATSHASATLAGTGFVGNDGNLTDDDGNGALYDWANLIAGTQTGVQYAARQDLPTGGTDNSFGQGTKESNNNVTVVTGSIPNNKADLARFGVGTEFKNGANYLYLAWSRENQNGTVNFDFEINKVTQPDLTTTGPKTLVRSDGDVLINYVFGGNNSTAVLTKQIWNNGAWGPESAIASAAFEGQGNLQPVSENLINGAVNRPAGQFGEAAINLQAAGIIPPNTCTHFGSVFVKSRASGFNSELKDFIAPVPINIDNCGTLIVDKVTVPSGSSQPFQFAESGPNNYSASYSLTDAAEPHQSVGLQPGSGYSVSETVPNGWTLTSATCTGGNTPANITIPQGGTVTCTFTNTAKASLHVLKTADRAGNFDFTSQTLTPAAFTLAANGAAQDFLNILPGTYDVAETVPANWNLESATCSDGSPVTAIVLSAGEDTTCTFHDVIERGAVLVHKTAKHAAAANGVIAQGGVTFTVTNTNNGTDEDIVTNDQGFACVDGLPVSALDGPYNVHETVPAGYHGGADQNVTVVEGTCATASSDTAAEFENIPLTDITVSVNSQVDGGTASTIDCGAGVVNTGANGDGSTSRTNLEPGTYVCTIVIDP